MRKIDKRKSKRLAKIRAAWRNYKKEISKVKIIVNTENIITSYSEFESTMKYDEDLAHKTNKAKIKQLVDSVKYDTPYNTARRWVKLHRDESMTYEEQLEKSRRMHTHEFYDAHRDEIEDYKKELKKKGYKNNQIAKMVSQYYYGS